MKYKIQLARIIIPVLFVAVSAATGPLPAFADTCTPTTQTIVSDTTNTVDNGDPAVVTTTSPLWTTIPGAEWIWNSLFVQNPQNGETITFTKTFPIDGTVSSSTLSIAGDDYYTVSVNGNQITSETGENNFVAAKVFPISPSFFQSGTNTITVLGTNAKYFYPTGGTALTNPGGIIYSLTVSSDKCVADNTTSGSIVLGMGGHQNPPVLSAGSNTTGSTNTGSGNTVPANTILASNAQLTGSYSGISSQSDIDNTSTSTATTTATTTTSSNILNGGQAAAAVLGLSSALNVSLKCILIALIVLIVLYIIWKLVVEDNSVKKLRTKDYVYFIATGVVAGIILSLISLMCTLLPLAVGIILILIGIYFEIL